MSPTHESLLFAKPHEEYQLFEEFLDYIIGQETDPDFPQDAEVRYAQTRKSLGLHPLFIYFRVLSLINAQ